RILVRVGHTRIKDVVGVVSLVGAEMIADFADPIVRRTDERAKAFLVRDVERRQHGREVLKPYRLRARLLLGHVVDAEELVVAEKHAVHGHDALEDASFLMRATISRRSEPRGEPFAAGGAGCAANVAPVIMSTTRSTSSAERNVFSPSTRLSLTLWAK